jgi:phage baseplate assembly protein W
MAIIVRNKFPVDTQSAKAVGVNIPFSAPAVFQSNYLTRDAIRNNLINFFSTRKGERIMNPLFGSIIQQTVFENLTSDIDETLKTIIKDEINKYFNFITLQSLNISSNEDQNQLIITITYSVANFGTNDTITVTI